LFFGRSEILCRWVLALVIATAGIDAVLFLRAGSSATATSVGWIDAPDSLTIDLPFGRALAEALAARRELSAIRLAIATVTPAVTEVVASLIGT
jgi:hypothetical protein